MADGLPKESQAGLLAQGRHYWRNILKWKWTAAGFFTFAVAVAIFYSYSLTPIYTASGSIWIEDNPNILPFEDVQSFGQGANLQSHVRLLQSRSLADNVIEKMKLYENPDFAGTPKKNQRAPDPADPAYRESLAQSFLANVSVNSAGASRLVDVRFSNRNPKLAADILNALIDGYIDMMVRKRYAASEQATVFLNAQIEELRRQIEEKERELNKYGSEKDILPLTAAEAPTVSRIGEVNRALTEATLDRVNKLNIYNRLKSAPLGEIPNVPEGSLIQRLREQYITLTRQYSTRLATVQPEFPAMRRLKSELDAATEALQNETQNLIRNAYSDYQNALSKEQSLERLLNVQKTEAYKANSDSVIYNSLRIELENKKSLLDALSKRQSETDVSSRLKGLEAFNVWIVDRADYPLRPTSPSKRKNVLMGLLIGLLGGAGLALGLEFLNQTVKTSKDIANTIGVPTLGTIPAFERESQLRGPFAELGKIVTMLRGKNEQKPAKVSRSKRERTSQLFVTPRWANQETPRRENRASRIELIATREPQSIQAESYRSIRTTLFVSAPPGRIKTVLFTSPLAREGKSTTVSNLAITLAEANKRVVIVDSDLRKPKQARIFGQDGYGGLGLSSYLSSDMDAAEVAKPTEIPNLFLITSGPVPANPIELLTSERMDQLVTFLKRSFDFVLYDTPPLLAVSDALAMGPMTDALILIARGGQTPISAIKQAKQKLDAHKLKCLGVILNGVDLVEQDGYYAREYYSYSKKE